MDQLERRIEDLERAVNSLKQHEQRVAEEIEKNRRFREATETGGRMLKWLIIAGSAVGGVTLFVMTLWDRAGGK